jgi:hypothetical protein
MLLPCLLKQSYDRESKYSHRTYKSVVLQWRLARCTGERLN